MKDECDVKPCTPLCFDDQEEELSLAIMMAHDFLIRRRGFNPRISDEQMAETAERIISVVSASFSTFFGMTPQDRYSDGFEQIAEFAMHLACDHIFPDGNKRTTVVVSLAFVKLLGFDLEVEDLDDPETNEVYRWIQDVVTKSRSRDELADFLRGKSVWGPNMRSER